MVDRITGKVLEKIKKQNIKLEAKHNEFRILSRG
jgi:hypothetical protein